MIGDVVTDPVEFVAVTVNVELPDVVGVPDTTPVEELSARPAGSDPDPSEYVGAGLPFATKV